MRQQDFKDFWITQEEFISIKFIFLKIECPHGFIFDLKRSFVFFIE